MIEWTDDVEKDYKRSTLLALIFFIMGPLAYLIVTHFAHIEITANGQNDILFYILLILAVIYPIAIPLIENFQIKLYHKNISETNAPNLSMSVLSKTKSKQATPSGLYLILFIIKGSFIESSFIFGLVVYLVSGDITRMLYFYPIGIAWSLIHYPTKPRYEKFLEKVKANEPV